MLRRPAGHRATKRTLQKMHLHDLAAGQKINISSDRLHRLAAHLQRVREEERNAIARDIHDELGQMLTVLKFNLSRTAKELASTNPFQSKKLEKDIELTEAIIQSVKRICTELRPGILDGLGLGPALQWQAEEFQRRSGIACTFKLSADNVNVASELSTALFRIFQESLTNVMRHAEATEVKAALTRQDGKIILEISDNGIGIDYAQLSKNNSFGILGMRERIYPWRGTVSISNLHKGTNVVVTVPVSKHR
jgi:signal transduction histidine kinase